LGFSEPLQMAAAAGGVIVVTVAGATDRHAAHHDADESARDQFKPAANRPKRVYEQAPTELGDG